MATKAGICAQAGIALRHPEIKPLRRMDRRRRYRCRKPLQIGFTPTIWERAILETPRRLPGPYVAIPRVNIIGGAFEILVFAVCVVGFAVVMALVFGICMSVKAGRWVSRCV